MLSVTEEASCKQDGASSMVTMSDIGNEGSINSISREAPNVVPIMSYMALGEAGNKQETLHKQQPCSASPAAGNANNRDHSSRIQDDQWQRNELAHHNVKHVVYHATGGYSS